MQCQQTDIYSHSSLWLILSKYHKIIRFFEISLLRIAWISHTHITQFLIKMSKFHLKTTLIHVLNQSYCNYFTWHIVLAKFKRVLHISSSNHNVKKAFPPPPPQKPPKQNKNINKQTSPHPQKTNKQQQQNNMNGVTILSFFKV